MSNSISSNLYNIKKNVYDFNNQKANNESTVKEAELNKEVLNMSVSALITAYSQGKLTVNDVVQWCNAYNCELNTEEDGVIKFDFQGKSYSISTKQTPASNVADSEFTYTLEDLKNSYKLEDNIIEKFFTKNATVETYTLKPDSGFSTIEELLNHVYNNYTNYNDTEVEVEGAATGGGTEALTGLAYYKARLQGVLASKKASVVQNLLAEFTTDFSSGNITSSVAIQILKLFGAGNITPNVTIKGRIKTEVLQFVLFNKAFTIRCNSIVNSSDKPIKIDGKIGDFKQGKTKVTWLAAGLISLNSSKQGQKIIQNSIKADKDGVTITFNGINKSYQITNEEIKSAKSSGAYSSGDDDVLVLELATEKLRRDIASGRVYLEHANYYSNNDTGNPGEGLLNGHIEDFLYYMTGNTPTYHNKKVSSGISADEVLKTLKTNKYAVQDGSQALNFSLFKGTHKLKTIDGKEITIELSSNQGMSVKKLTEKTITIVNPTNSTEYTMTLENFAKLGIRSLTIISTEQYNFDSVKDINANALFGNKTSYTLDEFWERIHSSSSDISIPKLRQTIDHFMEYYAINNDYDKEDFIKSLIKNINSLVGIKNDIPVKITKQAIEKLNNIGGFYQLDYIFHSSDFRAEYYNGVDGYIDDFGQGATGDCWLLTALISLNSTMSGKQILRDSVKTDADGNITVTFKGINKSYTISREEMVEARQTTAYSNGDNDVQAIELATEKLRRDISAGRVKLAYGNNGAKDTDDGSAGAGINGGHTYNMLYYLTGNKESYFVNSTDSKDKNNVLEFLRKSKAELQSGKQALFFYLRSGNYETKTIDGKTLNLELSISHSLSITHITDNTVTIINPWNSDEKYTLSWQEFLKLSPYYLGATSTTLNDAAKKTERQTYANKQVDNYKTQLKNYSGASEKFADKVKADVTNYTNGKITKDAFDKNIKSTYDAVLKEAKAAANEAAKKKTERQTYANKQVDNYKTQLKNYSGASEKFADKVKADVTNYTNGKITKDAFDKNIKSTYDAVLKEAKAAANEAAKKKTERQTYANKQVDNYKTQLKNYSGASEKFVSFVSSLVQQYIDSKIEKSVFDSKLSELYNYAILLLELTGSITENTTVKKNDDGTYVITIKNNDGSKEVRKYNTDKQLVLELYYDTNGVVVTRGIRNYDDNKNLTSKITKNYNKDGGYTQFTYRASTGAVTRKDFDKDGKDVTVSGYSQIKKGKFSKHGINKTTQQLYNHITSNLDQKFCHAYWSDWSTREILRLYVGKTRREETLSITLMEASQVGKGKPSSSSKTYNSTSETGFETSINQWLKSALKNAYGYDPEDVKGYFFSSSSNMSKEMATHNDMKTFVRKNIEDLILGKNLPKSLQFASGDLYYAVSNARVLSSKLSGKTLTLKVFDIYDFDLKYIDKLNDKSSGGIVLNAAGAAAMKDGKFVPYYHITEVKIDLSKIFTASQLKKLGIS